VLLYGTPGWAKARFPVWRGLVPHVEFWKLVYSEFTSAQAIVHDRNRLGVVYEIVDYAPMIEAAGSVPGLWEEQQPFLDNIKAYYQGVLLSIAKNGQKVHSMRKNSGFVGFLASRFQRPPFSRPPKMAGSASNGASKTAFERQSNARGFTCR